MKALILVFLFIFGTQAQAQFSCRGVFARTNVETAIQNLAQLRIQLDVAQAQADSRLYLSSLKVDYQKKETELIFYVEKNKLMNQHELREKIRLEIARQQNLQIQDQKNEEKEKIEQKERLDEIAVDGRKLFFPEIYSLPFAMAATVTTQVIWKKIVMAAQKEFPAVFDSLNADPSAFKGDLRPVESVSFENVQLWIEALNKLAAAQPSLVGEIIPHHRQGDTYRLPENSEFALIAGKINFPSGNMSRWAFLAADANTPAPASTNPVASREPLRIGQAEFFDYFGNVWQMTSTSYKEATGRFPLGQGSPREKYIWGGYFKSISELSWENYPKWYGLLDPNRARNNVGFRLVRIGPTE